MLFRSCDKGGSPWSTPWFFTGKKDGGLRPLQDYCVVNSWTVRDIYPILRIEQILKGLEGKVLFAALDICWGYHNIQIHDEDQWKAVFKTPYGIFKPKVMFFGLANSPPVMDDRNRTCTHGAKAKPEGSEKVRNCHCRSHEHDTETSHV